VLLHLRKGFLLLYTLFPMCLLFVDKNKVNNGRKAFLPLLSLISLDFIILIFDDKYSSTLIYARNYHPMR